jgi:phage terminase small subunit
MKGHGEKLTRKQEQAIAALLSEATVASAAERAGISEVTLWRWLKQPEFKAPYREARREVVEKAVAQLQQSSWAASTTLLKLLAAQSESVRLRAAMAILDHANKGLEMIDFEERIAALEQKAEAAHGPGGRRAG